MKLSSSGINELSRDTPLGTVQTGKVVQVYNENNIKYTFKVYEPSNANSVINMIVVDMGDQIIEYFIQYIFNDKEAHPKLDSGIIDMSVFTGSMIVYNNVGTQIGTFGFTDGITTDADGSTDPCDEVGWDFGNDDDNTPTGGGSPPASDDSGVDNDYNEGSGGSSGGNNETIDTADCGLGWGYESCGCPTGPLDGHEITGNPCCNGSPLVVTNTCTGQSWSSRSGNSVAKEGDDPCFGDAGVLLDSEAVDEFNELIEEDLFALIEIDCDQIEHWQALAQHTAPPEVIAKIDSLPSSLTNNFEIQSLNNAGGTMVNLDYFSVKVDTLPNKPNTDPVEQFTADELIDHIRTDFNNFVEGSTFDPYCENINPSICDQETELWNSENPLSSIIYIDIPGDDGVVVCTEYEDNYWYFMTMNAPYAGNHPVSGTRQFGYEQNDDGTFNFFVRGVDRFDSNTMENGSYLWEWMFDENNTFDGADSLWESFQTKTNAFVSENGGTSSIVTPVKNRPDWEKVRQVLLGELPISELGCND